MAWYEMPRLDKSYGQVFFFFFSFPPSFAKYTTYDSPGGEGSGISTIDTSHSIFQKNNGGGGRKEEKGNVAYAYPGSWIYIPFDKISKTSLLFFG